MLLQIKNRFSQEVQFRLGHKTIIKINNEWSDFDQKILMVTEWEDLKDYCLQNNEKVVLETKGFVQGLFSDPNQTWTFSFTEWKDCMKAHFSFIPKEIQTSNIQFAPYYECLKKKSGLHFIAGQKKNGKSTLLSEIISESQKYSPALVGVHARPSQLTVQNLDSVVHLGTESLSWDGSHPIYDGIDTLIMDMNEIVNLNKWIRFAEEGRAVYISLSSNSIENVLSQIRSLTYDQISFWGRFCDQLSSVIYQKIVSGLSTAQGSSLNSAVHEIWILNKEDQKKMSQKLVVDLDQSLGMAKGPYQSLNQSILQSLVRRRIDVKKAFELSNDIEDLDRSLKKMGL